MSSTAVMENCALVCPGVKVTVPEVGVRSPVWSTRNQLTDAFPWDPPPLTMVTVAEAPSTTTTRDEEAEKANTPAALWLGRMVMVRGLPMLGTPKSMEHNEMWNSNSPKVTSTCE